MGSEDRQAGLTHGRQLIRARQFDVELLLKLWHVRIQNTDGSRLFR